MSYSKQLTNLAWASEQSLGKLVAEQEAENEKTRALDAVEVAWDEAQADGVVDARELESLLELAQSAGLEPFARTLDESGRDAEPLTGAALAEMGERLKKTLRNASADNTRGSSARQLLLQLGMSEMKALYESASSASRTEHQAYMTVISNLKA